ncbi:MAG: hypothetical protein HQL42_15600 [Alphaproteobacteria bacterium]|nr:hypothetical protein [Alphaproteobacteria bacterium]
MDTDNIEQVARALCEREVRTWKHTAPSEVPALIERYWPVYAAKLSSGLIDDDGRDVPHTVERGLEAWETWLDEQTGRARRDA